MAGEGKSRSGGGVRTVSPCERVNLRCVAQGGFREPKGKRHLNVCTFFTCVPGRPRTQTGNYYTKKSPDDLKRL